MSAAQTDMYQRPSIDEIRRRVEAARPPQDKPEPQPEGDVLSWFAAHFRAALRSRDLTRREFASMCGADNADITRAANGNGCPLALAGRIATALGLDLADMIRPVSCRTCTGHPPVGFRCLDCGEESRAT